MADELDRADRGPGLVRSGLRCRYVSVIEVVVKAGYHHESDLRI